MPGNVRRRPAAAVALALALARLSVLALLLSTWAAPSTAGSVFASRPIPAAVVGTDTGSQSCANCWE